MIYGPWEDRQRVWLQTFFLPADFERREPSVPVAGYMTNCAAFHTSIQLRGSVRLHVPFSPDCSAREMDFTSGCARDDECTNFFTLASGKPFYLHQEGQSLAKAAAPHKRAMGGATAHVSSRQHETGRGIVERWAARAGGNMASVGDGEAPESLRTGEVQGQKEWWRQREAGEEAEDAVHSGSESEFSEDSWDSYQSSEVSFASSEALDADEDSEWHEILSRSDLETLPLVGSVVNTVLNCVLRAHECVQCLLWCECLFFILYDHYAHMMWTQVPFWIEEDGAAIDTDVQLVHAVQISSNIPSEVDHGVFWRSESLRVLVQNKFGVDFHDKNDISIEIESNSSTVMMLRDHGRLISAVLADWAWRPNLKQYSDKINNPVYFVPSSVEFGLNLVSGFQLGLILNDDNVVDDFANSEQNSVLWLSAQRLGVKTLTSNRSFQPDFGRTEYSVHVPDLRVSLHEKPAANVCVDAPGPFPDCITAAALLVKGTFAAWRPSNRVDPPLDTSEVHIEFKQLTALAHGMVVHRLVHLIKNYFGSVSLAISRHDFETTIVRTSVDTANSNDLQQCISGWNRRMHDFNVYQADKKIRPTPCEIILHFSLSDVVLKVPEHESTTAKQRFCAFVSAREVLVELRSMPDSSQLVVCTSNITIQFESPDAISSSLTEAPFPGAFAAKCVGPSVNAGSHAARTAARRRGSGIIVVDRVEWLQDSYLGPGPDHEAYKILSRCRVGKIDGEVTPNQVLPLLGAISQLTEGREAVFRNDYSHLPGRLWQPVLAYSILEASVEPVRLAVCNDSFFADLTLTQGLTATGNNLICSAHNSITTIVIPSVSSSLHRFCDESTVGPAEPIITEYSRFEGRENGASGLEEELLELARLETNFHISLTNKSSNWEHDSLVQYDWILSQDHGSNRHGLHHKEKEEEENYHDADEPTTSSDSLGEQGKRGGLTDRTERTSEAFLTADDFLTGDDISWQSQDDSSSEEDLASRASFVWLQQQEEDGLVLTAAHDQTKKHSDSQGNFLEGNEKDINDAQSDGFDSATSMPRLNDPSSRASDSAFFSSAPTTPNFTAGGPTRLEIDDAPFLSRRSVQQKKVSHCYLDTAAREGGNRARLQGSLQTSVTAVRQLRIRSCDAAGVEGQRANTEVCMLDQCRFRSGHEPGVSDDSATDSPNVLYAWHLLDTKAFPTFRPLSLGGRSTPRLQSGAWAVRPSTAGDRGALSHNVLSKSGGDWHVTAGLVHQDHSSMGRCASLPGTMPMDRGRERAHSASFSRSDGQSADVSLGRVILCSKVHLGVLNIKACPQALQAVDSIASSIPNKSDSVEGCLDFLQVMTKDPREAPLSFAFYGQHQVKHEINFSADGVECQLSHYLVPLCTTSDRHMPSPTTTEHAGTSAGVAVEQGKIGVAEDVGRAIGGEDKVKMLISVALLDLSIVQSITRWSRNLIMAERDLRTTMGGGESRRVHGGASRIRTRVNGGKRVTISGSSPSKGAGSAARHLRHLFAHDPQRENVSEMCLTCRSVQGCAYTLATAATKASSASGEGQNKSGQRAWGGIPRELLARTCSGSPLLNLARVNGDVIFALYIGEGSGAGEEAAGAEERNAVTCTTLKREILAMEGVEEVEKRKKENAMPMMCTATMNTVKVLNAASAPKFVLPAAHVWQCICENISHTIAKRRWILQRNMSLLLDQPLPEIPGQHRSVGLSRSQSVNRGLHLAHAAPHSAVSDLKNAPHRSHSDNPKSVLKGTGHGESGIFVPAGGIAGREPQRHHSDETGVPGKKCSPLVSRLHRRVSEDDVQYARWMRVCYSSALRFVRHCSRADIDELQAALTLPISWSMLSHRMLENLSEQVPSTPFLLSAPESQVNLEIQFHMQSIRCYLVHESLALGTGGTAQATTPTPAAPASCSPTNRSGRADSGPEMNCAGRGADGADKFGGDVMSEIHLTSSKVMLVSDLRIASPEEVVGRAEQGQTGTEGSHVKSGRHSRVRDVVCQFSSGKWHVNVLPPLVAEAMQIAQLLSVDSACIARASYPDVYIDAGRHKAEPSAALPAGTPGPSQSKLPRSVSFRESPIDLVAESSASANKRFGAVQVGGVGQTASWREARSWMERNQSAGAAGNVQQRSSPAACGTQDRGEFGWRGWEKDGGVAVILPCQGSVRRLGVHGEGTGRNVGGGASLAAALSSTEGLGSWLGAGGRGGGHKRTGSLPSVSAMQCAVDISDAAAVSHAHNQKMRQNEARKPPVLLHVQIAVEASITALVPGEGHLSVHVPAACVAFTRYPVAPAASVSSLETSLCISLDHAQLKLIKAELGSGPLVVANNVRSNILSSTVVPAPTDAPRSAHEGGDLKSDVLLGKRRHLGVTLDMDTLQAKSVHLHQVDGKFAHQMLSAWRPVAEALRSSTAGVVTPEQALAGRPQGGGSGHGDGVYRETNMAAGPTDGVNQIPASIDVTVCVRRCTGDVRVMQDVEFTYDTYDEHNQGFYATLSRYSKICRPALKVGGADNWASLGEGKLMAQSEMCFKLHKSRLRSVKNDVKGKALSKATFYFPEVQAAGTMKSRFNWTSSAGMMPAAERGTALTAIAGAGEDTIPTITDVDIRFVIQRMCNEVRQDMLNFFLEIQRTMKTEINMFLQAAEKYAASLGKKRETRAAMGVQLHFTITCMLLGIRLRALAPDTALLLDTGFFTFEVVGRPTQGKSSKEKALQWKIGLEGLSIAATSHHQRPGSQAKPVTRELPGTAGAGVGTKTWVLAHVRTNLEMQNRADHLTLEPTEAIPVPGTDSAAQPLWQELSTFSLNLSQTEATAHPGSVGCLRLLYTHFAHAIALYQHQRQFIHLEELDHSIQRMVRTGRDAAEGRIKKAAPVLISKLSNFCMQVAIKETWLSLMNSHEVPNAFAFDVGAQASTAEIFDAIDLRDLGKRTHKSTSTRNANDDNALIAYLELIELRGRSSSLGAGGAKKVLSHLEFLNLEVGFASAVKKWAARLASEKGSSNKSAHSGLFHATSADLPPRWQPTRYNPGRILLERASADLEMTSKSSATLQNAEEVHACLDLKVPGLDVELNANSFEIAFMFYNAWVATAMAGAGIVAMPSPPMPTTASAISPSKLSAPVSLAGDIPDLSRRPVADPVDTGAGSQPEKCEPATTTASLNQASGGKFVGLTGLQRLSRTISWGKGGFDALESIDIGGAANAGHLNSRSPASPGGSSAAITIPSGMEAYRAKLRLLSLDVTICARAGHLTVFEKDNQQEEDAWRRKGPGKSLSSDEGKGELLRVPLPEFDVAGNATLVLALGGLQGHTVEWVAHDKALINKVPVDLPDSIVACMFRMPRDVFTESATETESLLFSPSILDFITDIQSLHRKHLKTFKHNLGASSTEQQPPSKQTDQHQLDAYSQHSGPAVLVPWTSPTGDGEIRTAAHAYTLPTLRRSGAESLVKNAAFSVDTVSGRGANEEINQSGPFQSSTVLGNHGKDREEVFCDPVAGADGNAGVAESKRDAAGLAGQGNMADLAAANKARAVPSGIVLMSDIVYSMKFAALDLKLSGTENGERGKAAAERHAHAESSRKEVLALLSVQQLHVTALVSHNLAQRMQTEFITELGLNSPASPSQWFSSVTVHLQRLSLRLAQPNDTPHSADRVEGGVVELQEISGAISSNFSRRNTDGTALSTNVASEPQTRLQQTAVLVLIPKIDAKLNLRSVGRGLVLLRAWMPGRGGAAEGGGPPLPRDNRLRGEPSPLLHAHAEYPQAPSWADGIKNEESGGAQYRGPKERHARFTIVLGRVQVHVEHPLGATECRVVNVDDGIDQLPALRRNRRGAKDLPGRDRLLIAVWVGFEFGSQRLLLPGPRSRVAVLPDTALESSLPGVEEGRSNSLPIYSARVGRVVVQSPKIDAMRDTGLDVNFETRRLLLHSHSLARYDPLLEGDGVETGDKLGVGVTAVTAGGALGCHAEVSHVEAVLSFDSVVFLRLSAEELRACTHVSQARMRLTHASQISPEPLASMQPAGLRSADVWEKAASHAHDDSGGAGVGVKGELRPAHVWVRYQNLVLWASAETLPTCRRVLKRFDALFQDSELDAKLASWGRGEQGGPVRHPSFKAFGSNVDEDDNVGGSGNAGSLNAGSRVQKLPLSSLVLGSVDIAGVELHVALFGGEMRDSAEVALLALQHLALRVQIEPGHGRDLDVYRSMELEAGICLLLKVKKLPSWGRPFQEYLTGVNAESMKRGRVGLRGAETIMYLPHAHIDLLSVQVGTDIGTLSRLIRCEFVSKFDHALQVSMDAFLYQFITDLVRRIKEASSSAYLEDDEFEPFSPAARPTSVGAHAVGSALPAGAGGGAGGAILGASPANSVLNKTRHGSVVGGLPRKSKQSVDYKAEFLDLEPQIAVLNASEAQLGFDIVSILGRLGFNTREDIVGTTHKVFINVCERMLRAVWQIHKTVGGYQGRKRPQKSSMQGQDPESIGRAKRSPNVTEHHKLGTQRGRSSQASYTSKGVLSKFH